MICSLVPFENGLLPVPSLTLQGVPDTHVRYLSSAEATVTVYPPTLVTSRCEKIAVSEEKKDFWMSMNDRH